MGHADLCLEEGGREMINVSMSQLVLIIMVAGMVMVGLWWALGVASVRRAETRKRKGVIMCRICGVHYEVEEEDITTCPACKTVNERRPMREI